MKSRKYFRRGKFFVGENFLSEKIFVGENFRHLHKISSFFLGEIFPDKVRHKKAVKIRSHPAAKVSCLNDHLKPVLRSNDAEHIIIRIGTNDFSSDKTPVQICQDIINLACPARDKNVKVSISSLIQRNDRLNEKVLLVNEALAETGESIGINIKIQGQITIGMRANFT